MWNLERDLAAISTTPVVLLLVSIAMAIGARGLRALGKASPLGLQTLLWIGAIMGFVASVLDLLGFVRLDITLMHVHEALNLNLVSAGTITITFFNLVVAVLCISVVRQVIEWARNRIGARLASTGRVEVNAIRVAQATAVGMLAVVGAILIMDLVGLQTTGLAIAALALVISVAWTAGPLIRNALAGYALAMGDTLNIGDVVEIDGQLLRIARFELFNVVARTKGNREVLIPHQHLLKTTIQHHSLEDATVQLIVPIEVNARFRPNHVDAVLRGAASVFRERVPDIAPEVLFLQFAEGKQRFEVRVTISRPFDQDVLKSKLTHLLWAGLAKAGVMPATQELTELRARRGRAAS